MRKKEPCYVITFASTADALLFEKRAVAARLPGRLISLPPVISAGCGMAWKIRMDSPAPLVCPATKKQEADDLLSVITALDVPVEQIHELML